MVVLVRSSCHLEGVPGLPPIIPGRGAEEYPRILPARLDIVVRGVRRSVGRSQAGICRAHPHRLPANHHKLHGVAVPRH